MKMYILFMLSFFVSWVRAAGPIPTAILPFAERGDGIRGEGRKVSDILFAELSIETELFLVDRDDLQKQLREQELGITGLVKTEGAAQVGRLTGAKLLVSGSVIEAGDERYLVARITSSETGKMLGAKVNGLIQDPLAPMVRTLAENIAGILKEKGETLLPEIEMKPDVVADVKLLVKDRELPVIYISVKEEHIGQEVIDPAVETELSRIFTLCGFKVLDVDEGDPAGADIRILGEGFSEFAARKGDLVSLKARVELKMLNSDGEVLVYDRQTHFAVGAAEHVAGKTALQANAEILAGRMIPVLMEKLK
jgi:hypothetical protein